MRIMPKTLLGFWEPFRAFPRTAAVTPLGVRNLHAVDPPPGEPTDPAQPVMASLVANQSHRRLHSAESLLMECSASRLITAARVAIETVAGLRSELRRTCHHSVD